MGVECDSLMITLICGPMFSGKTTELLRRLERADLAGKKPILLRPKTDTRGFLTHTLSEVSWLKTKFVEDLRDVNATFYDTVGIDEGQFHHGLKEFCVKWGRDYRNIVISALHATSECEMFESIIDIIPYCDKIIKLNAVCMSCGSDNGNYTHYKAGNKIDKVAVGGTEEYTSLCRNCYFGDKK